MILKFKVKPTPDSKDIGIMYFVEQNRVKVGSVKSEYLQVEFYCKTFQESQAKGSKIKTCKMIANYFYIQSVTGLKIENFNIVMEKIKALGHIVEPTETLGRTMR